MVLQLHSSIMIPVNTVLRQLIKNLRAEAKQHKDQLCVTSSETKNLPTKVTNVELCYDWQQKIRQSLQAQSYSYANDAGCKNSEKQLICENSFLQEAAPRNTAAIKKSRNREF